MKVRCTSQIAPPFGITAPVISTGVIIVDDFIVKNRYSCEE